MGYKDVEILKKREEVKKEKHSTLEVAKREKSYNLAAIFFEHLE